jgi:trehalose 6-phosphate phosphatase
MGGHAGVSFTRDILHPDHVSVLRTFTRSRVLLAFDYDGTLSPIAPTPERARLPVPTKRLLARVAKRYPLAVISGRALDDISARVADIGAQHVFGNHGLEWSGAASRPGAHVRRWVDQLRTRLAEHDGIFIEDKTYSVSVHYRAAADHKRALRLILPVARSLPGVRIICGAAAVNLLPDHGANKGVALCRALDITGCQRAIYAGDDETDEDAFAALEPDRLLAIRIGSSAKSHARYHLDSQQSIDLLLRALIEAREGDLELPMSKQLGA